MGGITVIRETDKGMSSRKFTIEKPAAICIDEKCFIRRKLVISPPRIAPTASRKYALPADTPVNVPALNHEPNNIHIGERRQREKNIVCVMPRVSKGVPCNKGLIIFVRKITAGRKTDITRIIVLYIPKMSASDLAGDLVSDLILEIILPETAAPAPTSTIHSDITMPIVSSFPEKIVKSSLSRTICIESDVAPRSTIDRESILNYTKIK